MVPKRYKLLHYIPNISNYLPGRSRRDGFVRPADLFLTRSSRGSRLPSSKHYHYENQQIPYMFVVCYIIWSLYIYIKIYSIRSTRPYTELVYYVTDKNISCRELLAINIRYPERSVLVGIVGLK